MRLRLIIPMAVVIAAVLVQAAFGIGQTYIDKRRVINAGVLVLDTSGGQVAAAAPYVFYIMSQRDDLKPQGWTFVNPIATGSEIFKNNAAYWLVNLRQTTLENLSKFDVLYLNAASTTVFFQMADRDKLRRFVDGGGCLWVDNGGGMRFSSSDAYAFFLPGVNFKSGSAGSPQVLAKLHPLVTNPFYLGADEIAALCSPPPGSNFPEVIDPGFQAAFNTLPSPTIPSPVVAVVSSGLNTDPTVAALDYGSGRVVFTSGFVGGWIQGPVTGGANPISLTPQNSNPLWASAPHLKLAYNIVAWASTSPTFRKGYRRTGASLEGAGAPLVERWRLPGAAPPSGGGATGVQTSPAIWKNVIFYSAGTTLYALDAVPENDLDMDGNSDDGQPDPPNAGYDIIWKAEIGQSISSPTVASMLDPKGGNLAPKDFVLVMAQDGLVHIFEALPADMTGRLSGTPVERSDLWQVPQNDSPQGNGALLPPVVSNGWIYAVGLNGKIYGHSPVLAAAGGKGISGTPPTPWAVPLYPVPGQVAEVKSGPTFGFIKSKSSGALIQTLSVVARPPVTGGVNVVNNDNIYSMPIFVSSDRLQVMNPNDLITSPSTGYILFRNSFPSMPISSYPTPEVWATNPDGSSVSVEIDPSYWASPNSGIVPIRVTSGTIGPNTRVYMTYAIDYGPATTAWVYAPPSYELPPKIWTSSGITPDLSVGGCPALGPNDTYYMGVNWNNTTGMGGSVKSSVYSVWFDGNRGGAQLKWNYVLHGGGLIPDPTTAPGSGSASSPVPISDPNRWGVWGIYAKNDAGVYVGVNGLEVNTSPAVTNDKVFVTATTKDPSSPSGGFLLCFKADPDFTIRINRPLRDSTTGRRLDVRIWQPDLLTDPVANAVAPVTAAQIVPRDMINYDTGAITITDFSRVRVNGMVGGMVVPTNTITPALPVWVYIENSPVSPSEVDLSNWNNLIWSLALPKHGGTRCSGISSSPVVLGDYVYFTCDDGYLYAVSVDASPTDKTFRVLDPSDPESQSWMPMRDPIGSGSSGGSKISVAGAGGVVAVPCSSGLYCYGHSMNLVTDNHRVLELGADGKVAWSCDAVFEPKLAAGVVTTTPGENVYGIESKSLNKVMVAQKFGPSDYLVVDSGNDRVLRIDRGGQVTWSLTSFTDPRGLLRSGEPKSIKDPVDARMWSEFEYQDDTLYYVIHTLVVDKGNFRIVDIIDRYTTGANGQIGGPANPDSYGKATHELNWVSSTTYRDRHYSFNSVQLVRTAGNLGGQTAEFNQIWASLDNFGLGSSGIPGSTSSAGGTRTGGAIVSMKYRQSAGPFKWDYMDGEVIGQLSTVNVGGVQTPLAGTRYFAIINPSGPNGPIIIVCDGSAIYEVSGTDVTWRLTEDDYRNLMRTVTNGDDQSRERMKLDIPFQPQRVQVLPNGRLLVVNSYAGPTRDPSMPKFVGEVFEIDRGKTEIYWYAPDIWVYPSSGEKLQKMKNAPNLDQPTCAQRLY